MKQFVNHRRETLVFGAGGSRQPEFPLRDH
jgi:hypothetical protein